MMYEFMSHEFTSSATLHSDSEQVSPTVLTQIRHEFLTLQVGHALKGRVQKPSIIINTMTPTLLKAHFLDLS